MSEATARRMRLTVEQYGEAIRAAFEHGYIDGLYHPHSRGVMVRAAECSAAFWAHVESGIREKMHPERAPVLALDRSRFIPTASAVSTSPAASLTETTEDTTDG